MKYLYHASGYNSSVLQPGIVYTGVKVSWDEIESNEWLYATTEREEAISQGFASVVEKSYLLDRYRTYGDNIQLTFTGKVPTKHQLEQIVVYLYKIKVDSRIWDKVNNPYNNLDTEYKTRSMINSRNIISVDIINMKTWLLTKHISILSSRSVSMKELMKELSQESSGVEETSPEEKVAGKVLEEGELLDGTPVTDKKESAIKEMMDHAEKARDMSRQLNELADKADSILKEDKVHLVNEITTEAFQMNYRHIMENAGLADGVVSFESSDKSNELNYLSNEARKMALIAEKLEDRILDFSPEGKIWSFLRADSKRMAVARGDIETYGDKLIRRSKDSSIKKIPVTWTLLGNAKEWLVFKDGKAVNDLTDAIITDLELLIKSFDTIKKNNNVIKQIVSDSKAGKAIDPNKMKQVKSPEIVGENILGDKHVKQDSGELSRMFGWTPANPPWWAVGIGIMFGPLGAIALAVGQKINAKNALEKSNTHIDVNKLQKMLGLYKEAGKILDRDEHAKFDIKEIDSVSGDQGRFLKTIAKNSSKLQGFLYEHMFFLTWGMAETMRGLDGSWDLFLGQVQV